MPDQHITSSPFRLSLILGLLLTMIVFLAVRQSEQQRLSAELDIAVNERRLALQSSFDEITEIMRGLQGLFAVSRHPAPHALERYLQYTSRTPPLVKEVMWLPGDSLAAPDRYLYPGKHPALESLQLQQLAGFDTAAVQRLQQGQSVLLALPHELVATPEAPAQATGRHYLLLAPDVLSGPAAGKARPGHGLLVLYFDIERVIANALATRTRSPAGLDIYLMQPLAGDRTQLAAFHPSRHRKGTATPLTPAQLAAHPAISQPIPLADHEFRASFIPLPGYFDWRYDWITWATLLAGIVLSLVVSGLIRVLHHRQHYAEQQVAQQTRALRQSQSRLQNLQLTTSVAVGRFEDKLEAMLHLGCEELQLEIGIVARIQGDDYEVLAAVSPDASIPAGSHFPLGQTYCRDTLTRDGPIGFRDARNSQWEEHPCYQAFGLRAYLGVPIRVEGKPWGTLNFSSPAPHGSAFSDQDMEFIALMAQWLGLELERHRAARQQQDQNELLTAISDVQSHFIAEPNPDRVFDEVLIDILDVTSSDYGLIGDILYREDGQPYLKIRALSNIAWNEETEALFEDNAQRGLEFDNPHSLIGRTIHRAEVVIANHPQADCRAGGTPHGHPPLENYLGMPIYHSNELVGMVGLANRDGGYDSQLVQFVEPLLGSCGAILWSMRNELRRARTERELNRFKSTLDRTLDCVFMFDARDLRFTYVNQGAIEQVGYSESELLGMRPYDIKPEYDAAEFRALLKPMLDKQCSTSTFETLHQHRDGSRIPVEIFLQYIEAPDEPPCFIAFVRDISARKKTERMKDEFIATVSHELRTPLTSIRGALALLNNNVLGELPANMQQLVEIAGNNTERLLTLINDILDISKLEAGSLPLNFNRLSLARFLQTTVRDHATYADQYEVDYDLRPIPEDIFIIADESRLHQVFGNLLSNAAKFSAAGKPIQIQAEVRAGCVRICVIDQGAGIPREFHDQVFEKFTQADSTDTRRSGGTGLGLSICRSIVTRHGGRIDFISEPDQGTTFYVELPLPDPDTSDLAAARQHPRRHSA